MVEKYIPKQGDIIKLDLNSTKGHEQGGYRPAIVISNNIFNKYTKMILVCPISSNTKDFPTHYILENTKKIKGSVFIEHVRSIDFESREVKLIEHTSTNDLLSVLMLFNSFFEENNEII